VEIDCYKVGDMLRAGMTPDAVSSPHSLATASGLLLGTLAAAMIMGALIGWALGSAGIGLLVGALVGIPIGVAVVYQVYGRASRK
jgi:F0F1-type ATP synthase assembly protein I